MSQPNDSAQLPSTRPHHPINESRRARKRSSHLEDIIKRHDSVCTVQIAYVDIVSYSRRKSIDQVRLIKAFLRIFQSALQKTAAASSSSLTGRNFDLTTDVITIFSGDGGAVAFPFEGLRDLHIRFATYLIEGIFTNNADQRCSLFERDGWCECHSYLSVRVGISKGSVILFHDLNGNYNIAGEPINTAVRVMDIAGPNEILLSERAYTDLIDETAFTSDSFHRYCGVPIKHNKNINVYQYINSAVPGLNVRREHERGTNAEISGSDSRDDGHTSAGRVSSSSAGSLKTTHASQLPTKFNDLTPPFPERLVRVNAGSIFVLDTHGTPVELSIAYDLLVDPYLVTQELYRLVTGTNPSRHQGAHLPVENVTWFSAVRFCNTLSAQLGLSDVYHLSDQKVDEDIARNGFRLLSEAEWRYICATGNDGAPYLPVTEFCWCASNARGSTQPVGCRSHDRNGLYDFLGNVWEWCGDAFHKDGSSKTTTTPIGVLSERCLCGGSFLDQEDRVSFWSRSRRIPRSAERNVGFRVARTITESIKQGER